MSDYRQAFEDWLQRFDSGPDLTQDGRDYVDFDTQRAWAAWQAGASWQEEDMRQAHLHNQGGLGITTTGLDV